MDNMRGLGPFDSEYEDGGGPAYAEYDADETADAAIEAPPAIGQDERRMQVRAYNFWTSQLGDGNYPNIEELDPDGVQDFRDNSVLLDFTSGIENPSIQYVGRAISEECGLSEDITYLDQVPPRSLLSRITDHYLQIIANRAPIGFEAEFVNDRDLTIMYRGILLPYSSDDDTIDFIYGVINWKEVVAPDVSEDLAQEIEQAMRGVPVRTEHVPVWADGPSSSVLDEMPTVAAYAGNGFDGGSDELALDAGYMVDDAQPDEDSSLSDWLQAARSSADVARDADARSREALYKAIGRAYDFSLATQRFPQDYAELLADNGITVQERAPNTPIVKLIFGAGYDKTRLTEFAAALDYGHRNCVPVGDLSDMLAKQAGGLKAIVQSERRARKVQKGEHVAPVASDPRPRLRAARARALQEFAHGHDEFVVLVARREADGSVSIVGSIADGGLTDKILAKAVV
jgi:hypothetical protein